MVSEEALTNLPLGFAVITTEDGMAAVKKVSRRSPDGVQVIPMFAVGRSPRVDQKSPEPLEIRTDIDEIIGAAPGEIMPLAEGDLKSATAAFDEAGQIEAALAARLNARGAQIQLAAGRLRKSLEKTAAQS